MSFIKAFVTKHIHAAAAAPPSSREAIAVFFYGTAPEVDEIKTWTGDAAVNIGQAEGKTRITLQWPDVSLTISIDPAWDKTTQMTGMQGWAERFPARVRTLPHIKALIASFHNVTACYGTVSSPGLDADGKALGLLQKLLANGGGFFFSRNSFYTPDGRQITGFDDDPVFLGQST